MPNSDYYRKIIQQLEKDGEDLFFVEATVIIERRLKLTKLLIESIFTASTEDEPELVLDIYKYIYTKSFELMAEKQKESTEESQEIKET